MKNLLTKIAAGQSTIPNHVHHVKSSIPISAIEFPALTSPIIPAPPTTHIATKSFADITRTNTSKIVVINPKSPMNEVNTRSLLSTNLNPTDYGLRGVRSSKNGGVVVECATSADRNKLIDNAAALLGEQFSVSKPKNKCPRIRITGMTTQHTKEHLVVKLKEQNATTLPDTATLKVVHMYAVKDKARFGAILELDFATFKRLIDAGKVFVGWDSCPVYEDLDIRRCFKCWGFNHIAAKCLSTEIRCPKCSGNHQSNDCTSTVEKCAVCTDASSSLHLNIDTNHAATSLTCPTYIHRVEAARRAANYTS